MAIEITARPLRDRLWHLIARIVSQPRIAEWLVRRSLRTPYTHITKRGGGEIYMRRWWLFNAYGAESSGRDKRLPWIPSIRIHHIVLPDDDEHLHDHPWDARTIVLHGSYVEETPSGINVRLAGDTAPVLFGHYHRIAHVSPGGVFTLFITWRYQGTWGFLVDGKKVPWREYLRVEEGSAA